MCLYGAIAAMGGLTESGCSSPIASLSVACGISQKVVRRELAWLAEQGWTTDEHRAGYATLRRIGNPTIDVPAE